MTSTTRRATPGGLIVNEDNSHFMLYRPAEKMTLEGLHEFIDQYAGTQVSHLFFCPNGARVNYRTQAEGWESIWDGNDGENHPEPWVHHCWLLNERGLDPYAVWVERCREKGISPWMSMRMNIYSFWWEDPENHFSHSTFWKEHPECRRLRPERSNLDFGVKAVRKRALALICEFMERYDVDGVELDWVRLPEYFRPGEEHEGRSILTDFMGRVRDEANRWSDTRGHPIRIATRVPARPETAIALGLDGAAWARAGLVDILSPAPFLDGDFDIPVERWRELLGPAADKVALAPSLESGCRGYPPAGPNARRWITNGIEAVRGFAASMLDRGADVIHLFNFMDPFNESTWPADEYRAIMNECGHLETVVGKPRRHIVTSPDIQPAGARTDPVPPISVNARMPALLKLHIGAKPSGGNVVFRAVLLDGPDAAGVRLAVRMNAVDCPSLADLDKLPGFDDSVRITQFEVPRTAVERGYNQIDISLAEGGAQTIIWAEVCITPEA